MENKATNRAEMSSKRFIKARLQYLERIVYKAGEATSLAACFALLFSWLTCLILPSDFLSE